MSFAPLTAPWIRQLGLAQPPVEHYLGRAALAGVLFVVLVVGLLLGWRWFALHATALVAGAERFRKHIIATRAVQRFSARYPRAWKFFSGRFARGEYLGLHLTIGFLISLAGLWLFGAIAEDVVERDPITVVDLNLLTWITAHATPAGYKIFQAISFLGAPATMSVIGLGICLVLATRREWALLIGWVTSLLGGGLLDWVLKAVFHRPRPANALRFLTVDSWSFPSGHSMGAFVGYGMLAYVLIVLWVHRRSVQIWLILAAVVVILAVGLSRIYLGVHYLSDVLGGFAVGLLWISFCISGLEVARRWRSRAPPGNATM